jgi:hypothetical protein
MIGFDGIEQSVRNGLLPDNILECLRTVFTRRYYKLFHVFLLVNKYSFFVELLIWLFVDLGKSFPQDILILGL